MKKSLSELEMVHSCLDMVDKLGKEDALEMLEFTFKTMSDSDNRISMGHRDCVFCNTYSDPLCNGCPYNQWEKGGYGCNTLQYKFKNGLDYSKQRAKDYKFMLDFTKQI